MTNESESEALHLITEPMDFCPSVISFQTELGSEYVKEPDGTFRRHKYDGTTYEPMEWTVFTPEEYATVLQFIKMKQQLSVLTRKIVYFSIIDFDDDDYSDHEVFHRNEPLDPKNGVNLLAYETDGTDETQIAQIAITFTPIVGYHVLEFSNKGQEYHFGHTVSSIKSIAEAASD